MSAAVWIAPLVLAAAMFVWSLRRLAGERRRFLDSHAFHPTIRERVRKQRPTLDDGQLDLVFQGLRDSSTLPKSLKPPRGHTLASGR
jgi:hypothetical protein